MICQVVGRRHLPGRVGLHNALSAARHFQMKWRFECILSLMRRASSILLVTIFSLSLIMPALFASDPYANLPACCRKDGKHRCALTAAMIAAMTADSLGPALTAGTCSDYPSVQVGPTRPVCVAALPGANPAGFEIAGPVLGLRVQPFGRSSYSRAGQKRGPPSLLA